jgi:hypothetical protein
MISEPARDDEEIKKQPIRKPICVEEIKGQTTSDIEIKQPKQITSK